MTRSSRSAVWQGLTDRDQHRDSHFRLTGAIMAEFEDSRQEPVISAVREQPLSAQAKLIEQDNRVVLTDIEIPFSRAVSIMVKWILAAIPAAILATIIVYGLMFLLGLIVASNIGID